MRVEPYGIDSIVHIVNRGTRGMPIVVDKRDYARFVRSLYFMNTESPDPNWTRVEYPPASSHIKKLRKPLVRLLAFTLMPNHFHLLVQETTEGGISEFMRKIGQSMTNYHNEKYKQKGSLFQGSYRSRTVDTDIYLRYVAAYIMVKNTFELFPKGGLSTAIVDFEGVWKWAAQYPFSSLAGYADGDTSPAIERDLLSEIFGSPKEFKAFAHDVIRGGKWLDVDFE